MKSYLTITHMSTKNALIVFAFLVTSALFAQETKQKENKGVFTFESTVIDYGNIEYNSDGVRAFTFTNTGNAPIIITQVKGSCGYGTYQTRWTYYAWGDCRDWSEICHQ